MTSTSLPYRRHMLGKAFVTVLASATAGVVWSVVINLPLLMLVDAMSAPASDERAQWVIGGLCAAIAPALIYTVRRFGGLAAFSLAVSYLLVWTWDSAYLRSTLFGFGHR